MLLMMLNQKGNIVLFLPIPNCLKLLFSSNIISGFKLNKIKHTKNMN